MLPYVGVQVLQPAFSGSLNLFSVYFHLLSCRNEMGKKEVSSHHFGFASGCVATQERDGLGGVGLGPKAGAVSRSARLANDIRAQIH